MGCGCIYIGKGAVNIARYDDPTKLKELSNTSVFTVNREGEQIQIPDDDSLAGGNCASVDRISRVTLQIDSRSYCPDTMAWAAGGDTNNLSSLTAITGETHKGYAQCLIPLVRLPDWTAAFAVRPTAGAPWVLDTDFELTPSGIRVLKASNIPDDADVLIDYVPIESDVVEAFLRASRNYRIYLDGANLADEKPLRVDCHKVSVGGAAAMPFKGNDPSFSTTGEVLSDSTKSGTGISKYYRLEKAA